jgi:lipoyl(octanoyl) transferase
MHGFALNVCNTCLPPFLAITPCGIDGVTMTSLEQETGKPVTIAEAIAAVSQELRQL